MPTRRRNESTGEAHWLEAPASLQHSDTCSNKGESGRSMGLLQDKIGLITGAGGGIGRGVARRFAREGASVVIAEIDPESGAAVAAECTQLGAESLFLKTDVTDKASLESAVQGGWSALAVSIFW